MKLFKTKYDITLNEVSLMFETSNPHLLCLKKYIPDFLIARAFERFMVEFTEMFDQDEISNILTDDITKLKITNRIYNLYRPLYHMLLISNDQRFKDIYKKQFGRDYNGLKDLKVIISEIERLKGKYKELGTAQEKLQGREMMSFEKIITTVEMILGRNIPGDLKLYQFKERYDLAVKRAKENG